MNLVGTNHAYVAFILLKVGELLPKGINCSLPNLRAFPDVGLLLLFNVFLEAFAATLINVFSSGQAPSSNS